MVQATVAMQAMLLVALALTYIIQVYAGGAGKAHLAAAHLPNAPHVLFALAASVRNMNTRHTYVERRCHVYANQHPWLFNQ